MDVEVLRVEVDELDKVVDDEVLVVEVLDVAEVEDAVEVVEVQRHPCQQNLRSVVDWPNEAEADSRPMAMTASTAADAATLLRSLVVGKSKRRNPEQAGE